MAKDQNPPVARNPFQGHGAGDTVHNVACGLEYVSRCLDPNTSKMNDDLAFGQFLILQAMAEALQAAKIQLKSERRPRDAPKPDEQTSPDAG